jgi:hypothetical protein
MTSIIARAFEKTGLFDVCDDSANIVALSVAEAFDEKDVYAKARAAGETFGAAGSISRIKIAFDGRFLRSGLTAYTMSSNVTLNMILGNRSVPDDYEPISLLDARDALIDSHVRAFIRDAAPRWRLRPVRRRRARPHARCRPTGPLRP